MQFRYYCACKQISVLWESLRISLSLSKPSSISLYRNYFTSGVLDASNLENVVHPFHFFLLFFNSTYTGWFKNGRQNSSIVIYVRRNLFFFFFFERTVRIYMLIGLVRSWIRSLITFSLSFYHSLWLFRLLSFSFCVSHLFSPL